MYRLTTSMPYLLNRLGVRMGGLFSRRIGSSGLSLPMYRVVASLFEQGDQKLGEIAAMTSIELSTMSRLIGSMASMGLVTRKRLPSDERAVRINLTSKGAALATQLMREAQHYEDVVVSMLEPHEIETLKEILARIYGALDILEGELVLPGDWKRSAPPGPVLPAQRPKK